jgi:hypothetical protein
MSDDKYAAQKRYYEKNREKMLAIQKAYREANKDKVHAQQKAWRERNKEKVREKKNLYQKTNPKGIAKHQRNNLAYYVRHKKKIRENARAKWVEKWFGDIEVPVELIEAKKLQLEILRSIQNEKRIGTKN